MKSASQYKFDILKSKEVIYLSLFYFAILFATFFQVNSVNFTPDAYYYFSIAQNLIQGQGLTFDGISVTTGFHPLWMIVSTLTYFISENLFIFHVLVLLITTMLFLFGHFLLTKVAIKIGLSSLIFIYTSIPIFFINIAIFQSGVESSLLFFLFSLFVWVNFQQKFSPKKQLALSSVILIFIYFTRIDSVFLIAIYYCWLLFHQIKGRKPLTAIYYGAIVAIFIFIHWSIMYLNFGTILPTSSIAIKSYLSISESSNLIEAFAPRAHILTARFYEVFSLFGIDTSKSSSVRYIGLLVPLSILIFLFIILRKNNSNNWPIILIGITSLVQLTYFALEMNGWMRAWYFTSWFILVIFGSSYFVSDYIVPYLPKISFLLNALILSIILIALIFINVSRNNISWKDHYQESQLLKEYDSSNHVLVGWTPDRATFFSDVGIRHLEGLVNGYDFVKKYLKTGQIATYIKDIEATHLVVSNAPVLPKQLKCIIDVTKDKNGNLRAYGIYEKHNSYIAIYRIIFDRNKLNHEKDNLNCIK